MTTALLGLWNLHGAPAYEGDEGVYTAQAFSVLRGELAPYTYWYDHPPLGWIQLAPFAWAAERFGLGNGTYIGAARFVMVCCSIATGILTYLLARRVGLRVPFAIAVVLLWLLSPLSRSYGRQVFLDNIGLPWLLLAFLLAMPSGREDRDRLWRPVGSGICFAVAVLSKETFAVFGPALLVALLVTPEPVGATRRGRAPLGFVISSALVVSVFPLYALLRGELFASEDNVSLEGALRFQFLDREGIGSLWDAESVRAELLGEWLQLDPVLVAGGLAAAALCLLRRRAAWIGCAALLFALPAILGHGYLPGMYVIAALPFLALALGFWLDQGWTVLVHGRDRRSVRSPRAQVVGAAFLTLALGLTLVPHWLEEDEWLFTEQENADWSHTLWWAKTQIPTTDTVSAPWSMWQELYVSGWSDPWRVVPTENADLDEEFMLRHPDGWREIRWIVGGPGLTGALQRLDLVNLRQAVDNAEEVVRYGVWRVLSARRS
jgi:hypothetical protein